MLGVVLWSDKDAGKAVIWCEDQGKLAYVTGEQADICADMALQAGDLVNFSLKMSSKLRFAENLTIVEENSHKGLKESLQAETAAKPAPDSEPILDQGAEIIPFRAKERPRRSAQPLAAQVGA